jgi:hypothetical protein
LELTKHSQDGGNDIQVVTDISVQVDGDTGRMSQWRTPALNPEWDHKELPRKKTSADSLVKDVKDVNQMV